MMWCWAMILWNRKMKMNEFLVPQKVQMPPELKSRLLCLMGRNIGYVQMTERITFTAIMIWDTIRGCGRQKQKK